jgi:photosystem II stability/assembly factor-like uncharacterized protein
MRFLGLGALLVSFTPGVIQAQGWTNVGPGGYGNVRSIGIDQARPGTIFAAAEATLFSAPGSGGLFRTLDGGATWQKVFSNPKCLVVAIDGARAGTVYVGTFTGPFRSVDGGAYWTPVGGLGPEPISGVAIAPDGTVFVGAASNLFKSSDGGATWQATGSGMALTEANCLAYDPRNAAAVFATAKGGVYRSIDGAAHWSLILAEEPYVSWRSVVMDPTNPATLYAALDGLLFRTTNGGGTWTELPPSDVNAAFSALAVDPTTPNVVYAAGRNVGVLRSPDFGTSWFNITQGLPTPILCFALDGSPERRLYGGAYAGSVFRLETASMTFTCSPSATSLCLLDGRFQVRAEATSASSGASQARATPLTPRSGGLWFFTPSNTDVAVKVLDGRSVNGHFWVFYGALSNVAYRITVTDTLTGATKSYFNPQGQLASVADLDAF